MYLSQQIAADVVTQVLGGRNLTATLETVFRQQSRLTPQQRAVAQDLSYGVLRFYGELQALLKPLLQKPLSEPRLHSLLLVALYQLNHDRAATHTVVDQAVKAASQFRMVWARGLVNGVLRNFLRQQATLKQAIVADEVARYSYPQWWIDKIRTQYPKQWAAILDAGNQHPPMTLRVNQTRSTPQAYLQRLQAEGIVARRAGQQAVILDRPLPVDKIPGFLDGAVSVQDAGAQHAARLLDPQVDMRVLDACCAPGGKTGHLLELADMDLLAIDSESARLQRTQSNLDRLGRQAKLLVADAGRPDEWWDGKPFDRILADVPCTASGIVRRHVDIKWLRRPEDIASFAAQQARLLHGLWQLLAKGGKLLYATCSIFHEENQHQIEKFLEVTPEATQLPLTDLHDGQLLPCTDHDGFFYALLRKD
ncbi:MAG TPA: 16S rRNA (cytosine(967)-C(5))-methyltransferase RsmB [Methylophilaceae bacterium]|nr:16S rRNA (cytosine(967)-C(5))-methyltransferase RsmB [Methylophilaceae bacterium]